jgi:hypothetical protein
MPPFLIKATRKSASLSEDQKFYWFYVGIYLEPLPGATVSLKDVALVEYHLEDPSINPSRRNKRVTDATDGFEYRLWLYGFIKVSADVITKSGEIVRLPTTMMSWAYTLEEETKNGREELSWD